MLSVFSYNLFLTVTKLVLAFGDKLSDKLSLMAISLGKQTYYTLVIIDH